MKQTIEIEVFEDGTFDRAAQDGKEAQTVAYARVRGRNSNGRFIRSVCYGGTAEQLKRQIESRLRPGEDIASHRFVIEVEGEWRTRNRPGYPKPERSFAFNTFDLLTGPSVVLARAQREGFVALQEADGLLKAGDVFKAYQSLEAFVASFTGQPAPSLDTEFSLGNDEDSAFESNSNDSAAPGSSAAGTEDDNPEAVASRKLAAFDSRHAMPDASPAADKVFGENIPAVDAAEVAVEPSPEGAVAEPVAQEEAAAEGADAGAAEASTPEEPVAAEEAPASATNPEEAQKVEAAVEPAEPAPKPPANRGFGGRAMPAKAPTISVSPAAASEPADEVPATPARPVSVPMGGFGGRRFGRPAG